MQIGTTISLAYQNQKLTGKETHCALRRRGYLLGADFRMGTDGHRASNSFSLRGRTKTGLTIAFARERLLATTTMP
jgi:hypothetical protein